jgi:hypothetical protein
MGSPGLVVMKSRLSACLGVCWNWKCALMSAVARSVVYAIAMAHSGLRSSLAVVLVEILYVSLTAGLYAGLQQQALSVRPRWAGDLAIVVLVPGLSQVVDWAVHRAVGAPVTHTALASVCVFTLLSALFHRHVMRQGTFLTGGRGHSLAEDFRRVPRLIASFVVWPVRLVRRLPRRLMREDDSELAA